jgi:hypothetical protein
VRTSETLISHEFCCSELFYETQSQRLKHGFCETLVSDVDYLDSFSALKSVFSHPNSKRTVSLLSLPTLKTCQQDSCLLLSHSSC